MGLDIGLHKTGQFHLLCAVEKQAVFRRTIEANFALGRVGGLGTPVLGDINDIDPRTLRHQLGLKRGELDLLVGGPPCQAFSTAGRRRSVLDPRGTLLWRFLDFVVEFQPKVFLMENVRGLVSSALKNRATKDRPKRGGPPLTADEERGSVLRAFHADLLSTSEARYRLDGFEVNSVNYGSPQIRERLLIFGNRLGQTIEFPEPTHVAPWEGEAEPPRQHWRTLRDAVGDLQEEAPELLNFSPRKLGYLKLIPEGGNWRALPDQLQRESMGKAYHAKGGRSGWWRRLTFDLPSPTLITMPNHASTSLCHPTETRVLSVREYARIQEFPDDWEICGTTAEKYRQIGNAVPVRLGTVAGRVAAEALGRAGDLTDVGCNAPLADGLSSPFRLVYLKSHIRTRRWYKDGEAALWSKEKRTGDATQSRVVAKTLRRERYV